MPTFAYRAATVSGSLSKGTIEADTRSAALESVRSLGLLPIEAVAAKARPARTAANRASRKAVAQAVAEMAILLGAGLTLDRALAVVVDNTARPAEAAAFAAMHQRIKEGATLSRAMAESPGLFTPAAWAMAEAGEVNGRLDVSLARLAEMLERAEALRSTVASAMVYPVMLLIIASGVILTMLLWVVPQFEGLFSQAQTALPPMTRAVMAASHGVQSYGLPALAVFALAGFGLTRSLRQPGARRALDRRLVAVPLLGPLIVAAETARFARVLGSLIDGGVALPDALGIARRAISNTYLADAVARVEGELKQGGGLTAPLAATGLFPRIAISFLRTGEETARLGPMLDKLSDVLDRQVRERVARLIGILTPLITVSMGVIVATVIASIMSAILGFNDLALTQ